MVEREPTGIPGLDELIEGGFPKGSVILLSGSPGTGKSIFSQQFLHTGATKFREKGLYISLEQRIPDIYDQATQFGWDFNSLEKQGKTRFMLMDISQRRLEEGETHAGIIRKAMQDFNPKRLVIDSLSPLANIPIAPEELISYGIISELSSYSPQISSELITRFQVHRIIMMLKDFPCTSIIISEIPRDSPWFSSDRVSEFMADGVIVLHYLKTGSMSNRSAVIEKLRRSKHEEDILEMDITSKGIVIKKPEEAYKV